MIRYICKYTPVEIFTSFGEEASPYNPVLENLDLADELIHRNVCSFSRAVIAGRMVDASETLVLTDCCDSIRRAYDVLKSVGQDTMIIYLPRRQDECGRTLYKNELLHLIGNLERKTGKKFNCDIFRSSFHKGKVSSGAYVSVMGARMGDRLMDEICKISPILIRNNTCTGLRRMGTPPSNGNIEEIIDWYSGELLSQIPCMRMIDITSRRVLVEDPNIFGIIYNTVKFCDYYGFEYAALRHNLSVPILKIETDNTTQGAGQMLTRLEAFFEGIKESNSNTEKIECNDRGKYFAGIDSGSTSTNVVILDGSKNIVSYFSVSTGARVAESASKALEGALKKAGLEKRQIKRIVTTGYGRSAIAFREKDVTEITCHAKGAYFINPNVRTIIDIGGQDSKIIRLNEKGEVCDFVMNDKCAAGTGRFLEMMASSLDLTIEEMGNRGLTSKEKITISSMCTVFAQSEVVSLIAEGKNIEDIVCGLNRSVAAKITALAGRGGMEKEWMMTGGVAKNPGVVAAIEERLGGNVIIPKEPEICGALGAALIAIES